MKKRNSWLSYFLLAWCSLGSTTAWGSGVWSEADVYFTEYRDAYVIGASAYDGWIILSAWVTGGTGGSWDAEVIRPGTTKNASSATGKRRPDCGASEMFSTTLFGTVIPLWGSGSSSLPEYSITAYFKGELSLEPEERTVTINGSGASAPPFVLYSTYDNLAHPINGYFRTIPNRAGTGGATKYDWMGPGSSYSGESRWPGVFTVEASAHPDGASPESSSLRVVGVKQLTASPVSGIGKVSNTDGSLRNIFEELIRDANNQIIPEEIPTAYSKQARAVNLSVTANPGTPWPKYSDNPERYYPTWNSGSSNSAEYLTELYGASTQVKAEKGFYNFLVTANCGNQRKINLKFIRVKFAKQTVYASWDFSSYGMGGSFPTHDVRQYLAGRQYMGCANSSTCTDLDCNHRGVYDESRFAWSVSGDADLVLNRYENGVTVSYYEKSFSPAAQAALPAAERKNFTGNIRFTRPGLSYSPGSTSIAVTATSEELPSETDTLTIIPQYINLSTAGVEEECYSSVNAAQQNSAVGEGQAGTFIPVNDNDSNQNRNVDRNAETEGLDLADNADLVPVQINYQINGPVNAANPIRLSLSSQYSFFKLWKDAARSELLLNGNGTLTYTALADVPAVVYLEATSFYSYAGGLSVSYSYSEKNDFASTTAYAIYASDRIALNPFLVDLSLSGVSGEMLVSAPSDPPGGPSTPVRRLAFEEFPGGELDVKPAGGLTLLRLEGAETTTKLYLLSLSLSGSGLTRSTSYLTVAEQAQEQLRELNFNCASSKVEFYERLKNANGSWQTDAQNNPIYRKLPNSFTIKVNELSRYSGALYLRPVEDSVTFHDIILELSYAAPLGGKTHKDVIQLTNRRLDVDVDSNNDGIVAVSDEVEDDMEETAPGKVILLNSGDLDGDGVVDRYDWQISGNGAKESLFQELRLKFPQSVQMGNCKVTLTYNAAPPPLPSDANQQPAYTQSENIRLWKKQSNTPRDPRPVGGVNQTGEIGGDYVMPTIWTSNQGSGLPPLEAYYTPEQLGGSGVTLYIEGVNPSPSGAVTISMTIKPLESRPGTTVELPDATKVPETYNLTDKVVVTLVSFDLDIDSDNTNGKAAPDQSNYEDQIEDESDLPGKIILRNHNDADGDDIPDYADGYDLSLNGISQQGAGKSAKFTPLILNVSGVDRNKAKIKFTYSASSPNDVTVVGAGTLADPYLCSPGAGAIRIWTRDGDAGRQKTSIGVNASGHFVASGEDIPLSRFGSSNSITLYVEGINGSSGMADVPILVELDPLGGGNYCVNDQLRLTVCGIDGPKVYDPKLENAGNADYTSFGGLKTILYNTGGEVVDCSAAPTSLFSWNGRWGKNIDGTDTANIGDYVAPGRYDFHVAYERTPGNLYIVPEVIEDIYVVRVGIAGIDFQDHADSKVCPMKFHKTTNQNLDDKLIPVAAEWRLRHLDMATGERQSEAVPRDDYPYATDNHYNYPVAYKQDSHFKMEVRTADGLEGFHIPTGCPAIQMRVDIDDEARHYGITEDSKYVFNSSDPLPATVKRNDDRVFQFKFSYCGRAGWQDLSGEQKTSHIIYTTYKESLEPNDSKPTYVQLMKWAVEFLNGKAIGNDKVVVDTLFCNIKRTYLKYGVPDGLRDDTVGGALDTEFSMCGNFVMVFDDFCRTQGVQVEKYFMHIVHYNSVSTTMVSTPSGDDLQQNQASWDRGTMGKERPAITTGSDGLRQTVLTNPDWLHCEPGRALEGSPRQYLCYPAGMAISSAGMIRPTRDSIAYAQKEGQIYGATGFNPSKGGDDDIGIYYDYWGKGKDAYVLLTGPNGICESDPITNAADQQPEILITKGNYLHGDFPIIYGENRFDETKWTSIVIDSANLGLNHAASLPIPATARWNDVVGNYPSSASAPLQFATTVEKRWEFTTNGVDNVLLNDGHAVNFFAFDGNAYMYDVPFMAEAGTIIENPFGTGQFPSGYILATAPEAHNFLTQYYRPSILWHRGKIFTHDSDGASVRPHTVTTALIPDSELSWYWQRY